MALHFTANEFSARLARLQQAMAQERLDAMLLFAQESMYWLTGYDTFGFCFYQTLLVTADGRMALLTRSALRRQEDEHLVAPLLSASSAIAAGSQPHRHPPLAMTRNG